MQRRTYQLLIGTYWNLTNSFSSPIVLVVLIANLFEVQCILCGNAKVGESLMEIDFHSVLENKSLRPPFPVKVKVTQCTFVNAQSCYITAVGSGLSLPGFDCNFLQIIFPKGHNCSQFKVELQLSANNSSKASSSS